jgi:type IV pilus assembly protein PilQ
VRNPTKRFTQIVLGSIVTAAATQPTLAQTPKPLIPNPSVTVTDTSGNVPVGTTAPSVPTRTRAIAPPVGDISVSSLDATIPVIKLDSNAKVSIVLKEAPVREVLEMLSRNAGLNLAYAGSTPTADVNGGKAVAEATVSLNLKNEPVENAFNYVLQISGYEANRIGNTIFVGPKLPDSIRGTVVRTLRMNQVSAEGASAFLTTQGAETQIARDKVQIQSFGEGSAARTVETRTPEILNLKASEGTSPLLLKGLSISSDSRLNAITLVGSLRKVELATAMLTRLDARRRQVALNVKIVDVNLNNSDEIKNSLSFGTGNGFISSDGGAATFNFGGFNPPSSTVARGSVTAQPVVGLTLPGTGGSPFLDNQPNAPFSGSNNTTLGPVSNNTRPSFGTNDNIYQPGVTAIDAGKVTYGLPTAFQYPTKFLSTLQAQIISGNGKILTDPTMVVQEGQTSKIKLTQEVFGGFEFVTSSTSSGTSSGRRPIIKNAGLSVDIAVNRIDDNGFVSVSVAPTVSAPGGSIATADGPITLLQERSLTSGEIRLRDGQTLILAGIIQDSDRSTVSKVPILGDIPILGALFRSTSKTNSRQEVIVLLTPRILNDGTNQVNYTPGNDARQLLQRP